MIFAATPAGVYDQVALPPEVRGVRVLRATQAGSFATVIVSGLPMDQHGHTALLVQRFAPGWQAVAAITGECDLDHRPMTASQRATLRRSIPRDVLLRTDCNEGRDLGPAADIVAIRRALGGPIIPFVHVVGDYAFGLEYGDGGGCGLYRRQKDAWNLLGSCKGAMDPDVPVRNHIPASTLCALGMEGTVPVTCR